MIDITFGAPHGRCDGLRRRDFLRLGAVGPLGLSLASLMASEKAGAASSSSAGSPGLRRARARSVLLVFLGGGLSHHDSFDPKPDALQEVRGKYGTIPTTVPGLRMGELLPRLAHRMQHFALVRSGTHENDHHETASNWVLSGRFGSPFGDHPSMGSVVAHETGFGGRLPPYVSVPRNPSFTWELGKSSWLGGRFESFSAGNPNEKEWRVRDLNRPSGVTDDMLARRRALLSAVDRLGGRVRGNDQLDTHDEFGRKAAENVINVAPEVRNLVTQTVTTKDGHSVTLSANICYCIVDARASFTRIQDFDSSLESYAMVHLARSVSRLTMLQLKRERALVERNLARALSKRVKPWGAKIEWVGLTDLTEAKAYRLFGDPSPFRGAV